MAAPYSVLGSHLATKQCIPRDCRTFYSVHTCHGASLSSPRKTRHFRRPHRKWTSQITITGLHHDIELLHHGLERLDRQYDSEYNEDVLEPLFLCLSPCVGTNRTLGDKGLLGFRTLCSIDTLRAPTVFELFVVLLVLSSA